MKIARVGAGMMGAGTAGAGVGMGIVRAVVPVPTTTPAAPMDTGVLLMVVACPPMVSLVPSTITPAPAALITFPPIVVIGGTVGLPVWAGSGIPWGDTPVPITSH